MIIFHASRKFITFISLKCEVSADLKTETDIYRMKIKTEEVIEAVKDVSNVIELFCEILFLDIESTSEVH